jgi:lysozyme family protein
VRTSFAEAITFVLSHEGGYSNDPDDPGGETRWGIDKRSHPNEDILNLTVDRAKEIYLEEYWTPIADTLPFPCDVIAFDTAVNQGMTFAKRMVSECGTDEAAMLFYRLKKYSAIVVARPTSLKYLRGWMNRVIGLHDFIKGV